MNTKRQAAWKARLAPYYSEFGLDASAPAPDFDLTPFDELMCAIVEDLRPHVVSFHFGLPSEKKLLAGVKDDGQSLAISSATTVGEACWLEDRGCDAIIDQGYEAGGHRGLSGRMISQAKWEPSRWCRRSSMR